MNDTANLWLRWLDANAKERLEIAKGIADESAAYIAEQPAGLLPMVTMPSPIFVWVVDALVAVAKPRKSKRPAPPAEGAHG